MQKLRTLAVMLAIAVMLGEIYRSWGDGRNIVWILDDILGGFYMMAAAIFYTQDNASGRAFFASAWGIAVGMLYMSFFSSLLIGAEFNSGNVNWKLLTIVKGLLFTGAIFCLYLSIRLPYRKNAS